MLQRLDPKWKKGTHFVHQKEDSSKNHSVTKCSSSNQEFWACQCLCFIKIILCWFSCRILSANAGKCTVSGPILTSTRAGLVIGHTEHFPGGPTHLRGRQSNIFNFFAITQGQRAASLCFAHCFVSCIDSVNPPITMRYRQSDKYFAPSKERFTPTSSSSAFPTFSQQIYHE